MGKLIKGAIAILTILVVLAVSNIYWEEQLLRSQAEDYKLALSTVEIELADTQKEFKNLESKFQELGLELNNVRTQLEVAIAELKIVKAKLEATQSDLEATWLELETALSEIVRLDEKIRRGLQWWPSVEALEKWVEENELPLVLIANDKGIIDLSRPRHDPRYDCDDYGEDLVKLAEKDGYRLMEVPVKHGRILGVKVTDILEPHVGTWTKINNVYYYVESVPPSYVTKIMPAD